MIRLLNVKVKNNGGWGRRKIKFDQGVGSGLLKYLGGIFGWYYDRIGFKITIKNKEYWGLINKCKIEDLTDIRKIKIDKNQPQSKRQAQFLKQVGIHICCVVEV